MKCYRCQSFQKEKIYAIPTCNNHKYCERCLSWKHSFSAKCCEKCELFFKALASTAIKGNIKCNLCTKWPETRRIKCEAHDYCNVCTEFVLKNDYKIFPQISKCEKCKNLIESLKISTKNEKNNYIKFNTVESQRFNSEVVNSQIIQSRNNRNSYQTGC